MLEHHDNVVENLLMWTRESNNKLLVVERPAKYDVFKHPEVILANVLPDSVVDISRMNNICIGIAD